jgi:two-component system CheB/CheR fusion protein
VIDSLAVHKRQVVDKQGRSYSLPVRPYRTGDNKIDGVVITIVDIDAKKQTDQSNAAKVRK